MDKEDVVQIYKEKKNNNKYTKEYYSAINKEQNVSFVEMCMDQARHIEWRKSEREKQIL